MDMARLAFFLQSFVVYVILVQGSVSQAGMPDLLNRLEDLGVMERGGVAQERHNPDHHHKRDDEAETRHERRFRHSDL